MYTGFTRLWAFLKSLKSFPNFISVSKKGMCLSIKMCSLYKLQPILYTVLSQTAVHVPLKVHGNNFTFSKHAPITHTTELDQDLNTINDRHRANHNHDCRMKEEYKQHFRLQLQLLLMLLPLYEYHHMTQQPFQYEMH